MFQPISGGPFVRQNIGTVEESGRPSGASPVCNRSVPEKRRGDGISPAAYTAGARRPGHTRAISGHRHVINARAPGDGDKNETASNARTSCLLEPPARHAPGAGSRRDRSGGNPRLARGFVRAQSRCRASISILDGGHASQRLLLHRIAGPVFPQPVGAAGRTQHRRRSDDRGRCRLPHHRRERRTPGRLSGRRHRDFLLPLRHAGFSQTRVLGLATPAVQPPWVGLLPAPHLTLRALRTVEVEIGWAHSTDTSLPAHAPHMWSAQRPMDIRGHLRIFDGGK